MAQFWTYDGVSLNSLAYNVRLTGAPINVPVRRGENLEIPGLTGRRYMPKFHDQRLVTLAMFVTDRHPLTGQPGGEAQMQANLDTLRSLFARPGERTLTHSWNGETRVAQAEVVDLVEFQPRGANNLYAFSVDFLLAWPWWESVNTIIVQESGITSLPHMVSVNYGGTARAEKMTILVHLLDGTTINHLRISNGSVYVEYAAIRSINDEDGADITIDTEKWLATWQQYGPTLTDNISSQIEHDGDLRWMVLEPGLNELTLSADSFSGQMNFSIAYKEQFV
jgi:hypothetical protein